MKRRTIKGELEDRGLTLTWLAERLGISRPGLSMALRFGASRDLSERIREAIREHDTKGES